MERCACAIDVAALLCQHDAAASFFASPPAPRAGADAAAIAGCVESSIRTDLFDVGVGPAQVGLAVALAPP